MRRVEMLRVVTVTPRDMARLVGVLNWWHTAVAGAKLMSRTMQAMSATYTTKEWWDIVTHLTLAVSDELVFWRDKVVRIVAYAMSISVPRFQEMLRMWEHEDETASGQRPQHRLISDGGPREWGCTLVAWSVNDVAGAPAEGSGTYPTEWVAQGW